MNKQIKERKEMIVLPEGGDGREVTSGGHDAKRDECESELKEAESKATGSTGCSLHILHPPSGYRIIGRVGHRWRLYWVHRRVDHIHCFLLS